MAMANTQAHYDMATIIAVKSFIMHCQVLGHNQLAISSTYKKLLRVRKVLNWMRGWRNSIGVLNLFVLSKLNPLISLTTYQARG
jgi:hypothetical protein